LDGTWKDVLDIKKDLDKKVNEIATQKFLTSKQYDIILQDLILSLYTNVPPRRNQDYQLDVCCEEVDGEGTHGSQLSKIMMVSSSSSMLFKTAETHGQQKMPIPDSLFSLIQTYLKFHPIP
jgi:hypothetical protein